MSLAREGRFDGVDGLVLTGGPSLYETRKHLHPNIHCLPSAVDAAHFAPYNLDGTSPESRLADELQFSVYNFEAAEVDKLTLEIQGWNRLPGCRFDDLHPINDE